LADHRVGRAALEEVEQHGPKGKYVDTVFFHEEPRRGVEDRSLLGIRPHRATASNVAHRVVYPGGGSGREISGMSKCS
jgi:hypothetical protein